jgi:uncharacterized protein YggE
VSFRIETPKVGALLDEAVQAGATRIDSVSFVAADATIATAQKQALREATEDAQAQADAVFAALKLDRKEIVGIQINQAVPPIPRPFEVGALDAKAAPAPRMPIPVVGGEQQVEATVTLQISY